MDLSEIQSDQITEELLQPASSSKIDEPELAQPLCTALQVALVDLFKSWSLLPVAVVGHSSGEIAAAYTAGFLDRNSAMHIAYFRGQCITELLQQLQEEKAHKGGMLAVGLSEAQLRPYLTSISNESQPGSAPLTCGCINSPQSTTVSGNEVDIEKLSHRLQSDHIFSRKLNVPVAYHSQQMLAVADSYRQRLNGRLKAQDHNATSPILTSSVTGKEAVGNDLSQPDYWVQNLVSQVKFAGALQTMYSKLAGSDLSFVKRSTFLLEVGPHCSLERPIKDTLTHTNSTDWMYDTALRRNTSSLQSIQGMVGRLAIHAYSVDIQSMNASGRPPQSAQMLIDLPKYAFNHSQSYWVESRASHNLRMRQTTRHELLGIQNADWNPMDPTWRIVIRLSDLPWLSHHKVRFSPFSSIYLANPILSARSPYFCLCV